jgi:hypothetical protein
VGLLRWLGRSDRPGPDGSWAPGQADPVLSLNRDAGPPSEADVLDALKGVLHVSSDEDLRTALGGVLANVHAVGGPDGLRARLSAAALVGAWASSSDARTVPSRCIQRVIAEEFCDGLATAPLTSWAVLTSDPSAAQQREDEYLADNLPALRAYVHAVYDTTQQYLRGAGVKDVTIGRGTGPSCLVRPVAGQVDTTDKVKALVAALPLDKIMRDPGSDEARVLPPREGKDLGFAADTIADVVAAPDSVVYQASLDVAQDILDERDGDMEVLLRPASSCAYASDIAERFGDVMMTARVPAEAVWSTSRTGPGCSDEDEVVALGGAYVAQFDVNPRGREAAVAAILKMIQERDEPEGHPVPDEDWLASERGIAIAWLQRLLAVLASYPPETRDALVAKILFNAEWAWPLLPGGDGGAPGSDAWARSIAQPIGLDADTFRDAWARMIGQSLGLDGDTFRDAWTGQPSEEVF